MPVMHLDEARDIILGETRGYLRTHTSEKAVLVEDVYARFRLLLTKSIVSKDFKEKKKKVSDQLVIDEVELNRLLAIKVGDYWSSDIISSDQNDIEATEYFNELWREGAPDEECSDSLRLLDRTRTRGGWVSKVDTDPPWLCLKPSSKTPAIVSFCSYKGGVGRSTALAAFAIQRKNLGEKVCIVDCDFDAPGIGSLFSKEEYNESSSWGVVDALLEMEFKDIPLSDYFFTYKNPDSSNGGEIVVFPAGKINRYYLGKISRLDLEPPLDPTSPGILKSLLERIRIECKPNWLLLDVRAGLAEVSGLVFAGLAHLNVLFSTASSQSIEGLRLFVDKLGRERLQDGKSSQGDCIIVHTMIPRNPSTAEEFKGRFDGALLSMFENHYYLPEDIPQNKSNSSQFENDESAWTLGDIDSMQAPHKSVSISYDEKLAGLTSLSKVEGFLAEGEYATLGRRVTAFFRIPS